MTLALDQGTETGRVTRPETVRVWDPLVRVFHWALVAAFLVAWATSEELRSVHEIAGYTVIGLIAVRVVWGLVGTRHARFSSFLYHPVTVLRFLGDSIALKARRYIGHNPAGGIMVVLLLLTLLATAVSGYMMTTDAFWGIRWVRQAHELSVDLALVLIVLHLVGVAVASYEHRENLVKAMITGRKRAPEAD